ncbi:hypothetical protein [Streptomyces sp. NBC_01497]|uniref:hypothetical protein n=1 Tax=Streptomyces sp. NBC_01497 TaxID=2903885 RepID=UPI002E329337|nr:hypothetical protein [Streptomyces sp. NBC_01497]
MLKSPGRLVLTAVAALTALSLTSCSTDSPPQQSTRLQKAAGLNAKIDAVKKRLSPSDPPLRIVVDTAFTQR